MQKVAVNELREGQTLARDVLDPNGNQLLKAGFSLTKVWIERLRARKVQTVFLEEAFDRAQDAAAQKAPAEDAGGADPMADIMAGWGVANQVDEMLKSMDDEGLRDKLRKAALEYLQARSWNPEA